MGTEWLLSVSVVYPCDHMPDWELWLPATAQHHERVLDCVSIAWGKIQIQNLKFDFY